MTHQPANPPAAPSHPQALSPVTHRFIALDPREPASSHPLSPAAKHFLDAAHNLGFPHDHLYAALDPRHRITHLVALIPQPGRTAMIFLSNPAAPADADTLSQLVRHACNTCNDNDFNLIQAIIPIDEPLLDRALTGTGFWPLADLEYLRATLPRSTALPIAPPDLTFHAFHERLTDDFLTVLEASYVDTLDCPQLRGLRDTRDVLEGHRATGRFDPELWTIMRLEHQPIGIALINPVPEARCAELVYLGLDHRHRGKRLGSLLLRHALARAVARHQRQITLAVDDRNLPAIKLYRALGFQRAARKRVLLRRTREHADA